MAARNIFFNMPSSLFFQADLPTVLAGVKPDLVAMMAQT
jgi:hypothetical protein